MVCDNFKVVELAKAYSEISRGAAYFVEMWNTKEIIFAEKDKLIPLFIGSVVCAKDHKEIYGMISYNKKEQKCEVAHAYPDIDENIMWKLDYGKYSCMADRELTVNRIDARLTSDLHDSERAFDLVYHGIIDILENHICGDLTKEESEGFLKDIYFWVDAEEIIKSVFIFSLMIEHHMHVRFKVVEKIVVVACVIMNHFISGNAVHDSRCKMLDRIVKISIGNAMKSAVKDNPALYGIDEGGIIYDTDEELVDFIEEVYSGFKVSA